MKHFIRICKSLAVVLVAYTISSAQSYAQSSEQAKGQVEALFQKGLNYYDAGDYDKAVETYTQVITLDATHVNAYWARGHIYSEQERHTLAVADFHKVTELAPDFGGAYGMLGWHLIVQGKFEEAREPC
jgi:Tfp pilus assembly protein PilF